MKKILLHTSFLLATLTAYSQFDTTALFDFTKKIPVAALKQDLKILKDSLEIIHPALYRYTNKPGLDQAFKQAEKLIEQPLTQAKFYSIAAPLISKVGDIHTTIELPDESFNYLATKEALFPFDVRIINKKVFIASNNSADNSIKVGSRILKINDHPIDEVLGKIANCFSDEGPNETLKLKRTEQRFAFQYHIIYGYSKVFKLTYTLSNKPEQTTIVAAQLFTFIKSKRSENQLKYPGLKSLFPQAPYLLLSVDNKKSIAILTIKWFQNDVLQDANEQFKPFIDSAFNEIRSAKIGNLIIDIRNNGGGESENASYLYAYLTNKPFKFLHGMETNEKNFNEDKNKGINYTFSKNTGKYLTIDSAATNPQFFGFNYQQPAKNNFTGKLYVLIDGLTTSAAPQFAALVKQNKRGILVGENAPGALFGGSGRGYSYFYLPNSGLLTMISKYRLYFINPAKKWKDEVVTPGHRPAKSFPNVIKGIDEEIEYTIRLITEKNKVAPGQIINKSK